jgi:hypothetical protein
MVSRLEVADKTNDVLAMKEEGAMNGRMALFVIAILTCQLSPPYLTRAFAADQTGVASVYSTESGDRTATGHKS